MIEIRAEKPADRVAGHILFSRVTIANSPAAFSGVGLGPVAVLPELQRQGIGSKLVRAGLERCRQSGYDAVVVIGHPAYYSRFGFLRAADFSLQNEYGVVDEFMALPLHDGVLTPVSGMVRYQPEFREAAVWVMALNNSADKEKTSNKERNAIFIL